MLSLADFISLQLSWLRVEMKVKAEAGKKSDLETEKESLLTCRFALDEIIMERWKCFYLPILFTFYILKYFLNNALFCVKWVQGDCPASGQPDRQLVSQVHKVHLYIEYHSVCPLVGVGTLPLSPASVPLSPEPPEGGGGTLAYGWGVGGVPIPMTGEKLGTLPTLCPDGR